MASEVSFRFVPRPAQGISSFITVTPNTSIERLENRAPSPHLAGTDQRWTGPGEGRNLRRQRRPQVTPTTGGCVLSDHFCEEFAAEWIASWNSHDIERILAHYDESFEFSSPVLAKVSPATGGKLSGQDAARAYWSRGLATRPDLYFEPVTLLKGVQSAVIYYKGLGGKLCAEFFVFGANGKVVSSHAHGA
jgi:hypothetical protein